MLVEEGKSGEKTLIVCAHVLRNGTGELLYALILYHEGKTGISLQAVLQGSTGPEGFGQASRTSVQMSALTQTLKLYI